MNFSVQFNVSKWQAHDYAILGTLVFERFLIIATNLLLLVAILYHSALRQSKQYLLIAGIAVANVLYGIGGAGNSTTQIYEHLSEVAYTRRLSSACPRQFKLLSIAAMVAQQFLTFAQGLDRYLAIRRPIFYYQLTDLYAKKMLVAVYVPIAITWLSAQIAVKRMPEQIVTVCSGSAVLPNLLTSILLVLFVGTALLAVGLHLTVWLLYRKSMSKTTPKNQPRDHTQQRRMTKTVVIDCLFAFLTVIIPGVFIFPLILKFQAKLQLNLGNIVMVLYSLSPIAKLAIYSKRQTEMRLAVSRLFKCQQLPQNLELLNATRPQKHTIGSKVPSKYNESLF